MILQFEKQTQKFNLLLTKLIREFTPYYEMDLTVSKSAKSRFLAAFEQQINNEAANSQFIDVLRQPEKYKEYGIQLLDRYYNQGILADNHTFHGKKADFVA